MTDYTQQLLDALRWALSEMSPYVEDFYRDSVCKFCGRRTDVGVDDNGHKNTCPYLSATQLVDMLTDSTNICPDCGLSKPDDERVMAGGPCTDCKYGR